MIERIRTSFITLSVIDGPVAKTALPSRLRQAFVLLAALSIGIPAGKELKELVRIAELAIFDVN
jgi:hypothetical protein